MALSGGRHDFADFILDLFKNHNPQKENEMMSNTSLLDRKRALYEIVRKSETPKILQQALQYPAYSDLLNSSSTNLIKIALRRKKMRFDFTFFLMQNPAIATLVCEDYQTAKLIPYWLPKNEFWALLDQTSVLFAWAESHYEETFSYREQCTPIIERTLCQSELDAYTLNLIGVLKEKKEELSEQEISKGLIALRYLIRKNDPDLIESIKTLLDIPLIREKTHCNCLNLKQNDNELFRLALKLGNKTAYLKLFEIDEVNKLTKKNHYYVYENLVTDGDLSKNVGNPESSMIGLNAHEQQTFKKLTNHYQEKLEEMGGPDAAVKDLQQYLETQYLKNPAILRLPNNKVIHLPLSYREFWERFKNEPLELRQQALEAYYKDQTHTCWRYFQKPNYWMSENTTFENPDQSSFQSHSKYDSRIQLIATCWLAAKDEMQKGEQPIEHRISIFSLGIAEVCRAHNWDKHHKISNAGIDEQYDDLLGDNPSCTGGTSSRVMKSLGDHPLISKIVNPSDVEYSLYSAIGDYYRDYFKALPPEKAAEIIETVDDLIHCIKEDYSIMEAHNIPPEKIIEIKNSLINKYGDQVQHYLELLLFIDLKSTSHLTHFSNELIQSKVLKRASDGNLSLGTDKEDPLPSPDRTNKHDKIPSEPSEKADSQEQQLLDSEKERRKEIINRANKELESIITDLRGKIGTIQQEHRSKKAYDISLQLLGALMQAKKTYLEQLANPKNDVITVNRSFGTTCKELIEAARPTLEKDLDWGDYLTNLLKSIFNALAWAITLGKYHPFFPPITSQSVNAVEEAQSELLPK